MLGEGQKQPGATKGYFVKIIKNLSLVGADVGLRKVTLHREKEWWVRKKKGVLLENAMSSRTAPKVGSNGPGTPAHLLGTDPSGHRWHDFLGQARGYHRRRRAKDNPDMSGCGCFQQTDVQKVSGPHLADP